MRTAIIVGDVQSPLHDPSAVDVALQIVEAIKPDFFTANGDWVEFMRLSLNFKALKGSQGAKGLPETAAEETLTAKGILGQFARAVGSKCKKRFNAGNHEWRLFRAMAQDDTLLELLNIPEVSEAVCVETVLGLKKYGYEYSGEYPKGHYLFDLQPHKNVYVHHGYMVRQKAGYQGSAETDKRMVSTITGHGERLAVSWRRDITDRRIFAAEGGNLSRIGEPGKGDGLYIGVPFADPALVDHQQGFIVLYQDGDLIQPICVPIHHGRAIWEGKVYKS